ncbi:MAG: sensor histidine kinase [Propionibacteriaceae bacterium]|nr:sensor histidine kinase [Propionibacteriaceae bacterium]
MNHAAPHQIGGHQASTTLRRLRTLGFLGPLAYVGALLALRPWVMDTLGVPAAFVVLGTALAVGAALFGVFMYILLGRAHAAVIAAERHAAALVERDRIARELHDSLAQVLGVAHLRLCALASRPALQADERARADLDDLADLCREAHRDVREAILGLKDADRPGRTLLEHLDDYAATFSRTSLIPTTVDSDVCDPGLAPEAEVQVIRVIQEALTNVRKHADAQRATIRVRARDGQATITIEDDGAGFDPHRTPGAGSFGLVTMRERVESVAGRFSIESTPGRGTRVTASLPCRAPAARPLTQEVPA